ncbi:START domain-containing protein [Marinobacter salinisoli]|uniref:START domain-containing protein n=1 Tax=Marinobacter salinisoli TaxID=2769486 RepID=A0ABX7MV54_9GAMM|nr:START domain-containing protein [Marinobacter salinisoli]QSP96262.1 START domain-containing protein [Marinobacter salinisoli]
MRTTKAHSITGWIAAMGATLLATVFSASSVSAQLPAEDAKDWKLREEVGNIRVYTVDQTDSSFKAFKAEALLDTPIENLMAVMINPESCLEWVHNCIESYAFGEGNFHDRYAYSVNNMPWPVTDRDYVLRIQTRGNRASGEVIMDLNAIPNQRREFDGRIRVDRSDTFYRFIPRGDQTKMIWIQHTDPNGSLPGWLVNSLLVDIPVRSLQALEKVAQKPHYQGFELVYDDAGQLISVRHSTE